MIRPPVSGRILLRQLGLFALAPLIAWRDFLTPLRVYFDDQCAFCTRYIRVLKKFDWLHRLHMLPGSRLKPEDLPYPDMVDANALLAVDTNGQYAGADAVFHALLRTPLLWFIGVLGLMPGMLHLARRIYTRVSRNRHCLLSGETGGACSIRPVLQYDLPVPSDPFFAFRSGSSDRAR